MPIDNLVRRFSLAIAVFAALASGLRAVDRVVRKADGREQQLAGRVVVEAGDGGLLVQTPDGALWAVEPDQLGERTEDEAPFEPLDAKALAAQLQKELPAGFDVHATAHFVIAHDTSREYAQWVGSLFERLYRGFHNYWTQRGLALHEPEFPLAAIVFRDKAAYEAFTRAELKSGAGSIVSFYSLQSNRIAMYDLTGLQALGGGRGGRRGSPGEINQLLARPEAEAAVATIVHEATHQLAYNCGLHRRFADIPLWVAEGLAVYFETPDLKAGKGWRSIGAINRNRLDQFRKYQLDRPRDSLRTLLADDKRFRDGRTSLDAYAEAWALNYYLLKQRPKEYVAYLKRLSEKRPMVWDDADERLGEFRGAFGELESVDAELLKLMQRVK